MVNHQKVKDGEPILDVLAKKDRQRRDEEKFQEDFAQKTYYEEYYSVYRFSNWVRFVFSLISAIAGFYLIFTGLNAIMPQAIAAVFAVFVLGGIEVIKHLLFPSNLKKFYQYGTKKYLSNAWNWLFILLNMFFVTLSIFISVKGVEEYNNNENAVKPTLIDQNKLESSYDFKRDSTSNYYEQLIRDKKNQISKLEKSINNDRNNQANYFNGKFSYVLSQDHLTRRRDIGRYNKQISKLEDARIKAIDGVKENKGHKLQAAAAKNSKATNKAEEKTKTNTLFLVFISGINEFLLLLCLWFLIHFPYKTNKERKLMDRLLRDPKVVDYEDEIKLMISRAFWDREKGKPSYGIETTQVASAPYVGNAAGNPSHTQGLTRPSAAPAIEGEVIAQAVAKGIEAYFMHHETPAPVAKQKSPKEQVSKEQEAFGGISLRPTASKQGSKKQHTAKFASASTKTNEAQVATKAKPHAASSLPIREKESTNAFLEKYAEQIVLLKDFYRKRKEEGTPKKASNRYLAKEVLEGKVTDKTVAKIKSKMIVQGLIDDKMLIL
ncbi:hypothetical protein [uncultured Microscilla sp.]|uniref:hypothetical protein n=1 Tax=uncultured Microscilla sp. TaxID=432653 RepID=UPI0026388CE5|nr:hypothetical protein [uncultured Microscilla sp.]